MFGLYMFGLKIGGLCNVFFWQRFRFLIYTMIPIVIKINTLTRTKMLTTRYILVETEDVFVACSVTLPVKFSGVVVSSVVVFVVAASVVVAVAGVIVAVAGVIVVVAVAGVILVVVVAVNVVFVVANVVVVVAVNVVVTAAGDILVVAAVNSGGTCQKGRNV